MKCLPWIIFIGKPVDSKYDVYNFVTNNNGKVELCNEQLEGFLRKALAVETVPVVNINKLLCWESHIWIGIEILLQKLTILLFETVK